METDVLLTPPPDSVDGVFADRYFLQHLQYEIKQIKTHNGVVLSKGQKWKRTPYDTLFEKDMMTIPRIIEGYIEIRKKKSKLSAGCRNIIQHMVENATHYMYNTYRKINCMT